jgi:hypothetical protein
MIAFLKNVCVPTRMGRRGLPFTGDGSPSFASCPGIVLQALPVRAGGLFLGPELLRSPPSTSSLPFLFTRPWPVTMVLMRMMVKAAFGNLIPFFVASRPFSLPLLQGVRSA